MKQGEQPPSKPSRKKQPEYRPWHPPKYEVADAAAVQAVAEGRATPEQQKRAMNHIVRDLCGTYDEVFIPDKMEETGYACGKRHVGLRIVFYVNLNTGKLAGKDEDGEQG